MIAWWRGVATVRLQTTLVAVAVTGVALLGASFAVLGAVRSDIHGRLEGAVTRAAQRVAQQLAVGAPPKGIIFEAPAPANLVAPSVQVYDVDSGALVAAIQPFVALEVPGSGVQLPVPPPGEARLFDDSELIRHTELASFGGQRFRVVAATPASLVSDNTAALARALAIGFPSLTMLVGFLTWTLAGRSLRPVEHIRAEVEEISAQTLNLRVPEPAAADEVARLARTMNRMLDRLESSARRQREFVSDASHELRSPVAAIRTELEVALHDPERANWGAVASSALAENERIERLVDDLLTLARLDEGGALPTEDVDLDDVACEEVARLRDPRIRMDVTPTRVRGNREQLARALRNLLENAGRYARDRVTVRVAVANGSAIVSVGDDGPGIPPEDRERVFERFTRLDEGRARAHGGVGLGLALVRAIAQAHGGAAVVSASPGGGASFEILLPAMPARRTCCGGASGCDTASAESSRAPDLSG